jgi:activator of HSP90 ATPase
MKEEQKIKTKDLKQVVLITATPDKVYSVLTDPKVHSKFTDSKATNTDKIGEFRAYGGYAWGNNLELVKNEKIAQTWTCEDWPKEHYSQVVYGLKREGNKTKLTFIQTGIPLDKYEEIKQGWEEFYWEPLKSFLK